MKIIITILFVLITILGESQQSTTNKIIIIGVVHPGNRSINSDSLLKVLDQVNPVIIFNESIFKQNASFFADKVGLNRGIDIVAPSNYLKKYPETEQIQIDIKFKSLYHRWRYVRRIVNLDKALTKIINRIYVLKETPDRIKYSIMKYVTPRNFFSKYVYDSSLYTINQKFIIDSFRTKYTAYENDLLPVINSYPEFSKISKRANKDFSIWGERNVKMVENVLKRMKNNNFNSPLVIICGLAHKYALEDLLKPEQEKYNFKLYDYWELCK